MTMNILIAGVGGQGTLLASKIIGRAALDLNYDVKVSEVHGMSQRGGSVVTYVKYSDSKVDSPIIDEGSADILLAFEELEALRNIPFLKSNGKAFLNTQNINPMPVIIGNASYPVGIVEKLKATGADIFAADILSVAEKAGSSKAVNLVLIGLLAGYVSEIPKDVWISAIKSTVAPRFLEVNLKAFEEGYILKK